MNEFLLFRSIGIAPAAACWTFLAVPDRRTRACVAREDRVRQAIHWAQQITRLSHCGSWPRDVLEWLAKPLVPADTLPLPGFQRCAIACGHDPLYVQETLRGLGRGNRRQPPRYPGTTPPPARRSR